MLFINCCLKLSIIGISFIDDWKVKKFLEKEVLIKNIYRIFICIILVLVRVLIWLGIFLVLVLGGCFRVFFWFYFYVNNWNIILIKLS